MLCRNKYVLVLSSCVATCEVYFSIGVSCGGASEWYAICHNVWLLRRFADQGCGILRDGTFFLLQTFSRIEKHSMIIFPDLPHIEVEGVEVAEEITLTLRTTSPTAPCPSAAK